MLFSDFTHVLATCCVLKHVEWRENEEDTGDGEGWRWQPSSGSPCAAPGAPVAPWNVRGWVSVS